jgi:hypothetical protein
MIAPDSDIHRRPGRQLSVEGGAGEGTVDGATEVTLVPEDWGIDENRSNVPIGAACETALPIRM